MQFLGCNIKTTPLSYYVWNKIVWLLEKVLNNRQCIHRKNCCISIYFCVRKVVASPCMMSQRLATKSKPRHERQAKNGLFSLFPGPKFFCCCQHRADTTPPPFLLYTWHKDQEVCQLRNVIHLEELNIGLDDSLWFFLFYIRFKWWNHSFDI